VLSILLPTARRSTPEDAQVVWGDLRVALASVAAYAPGVDLVVAWNGLEKPEDLPPNPCMRLLRQPEGIATGSEAWNWCATQTSAEHLLVLGDDCVLHPDTLGLMLQDIETIHREAPLEPIGFVGTRSNYVKGPQNVRNGTGTESSAVQFDSELLILRTEMVVPVCAWVEHVVFDLVGGFPATNWFADDVICWDMSRLGYTHFVSRAYVHHVGQRATAQGKSNQVLAEEGLHWLQRHRPDFLVERLGMTA